MNIPVRIQLRRTKGFRLLSPDDRRVVKVDRSTKWGNPFIVGREHPYLPGRIIQDRRHAWSCYQGFAPFNDRLVAAAEAELQGCHLACWCPLPDGPLEMDICHADILRRIANGWPTTGWLAVEHGQLIHQSGRVIVAAVQAVREED